MLFVGKFRQQNHTIQQRLKRINWCQVLWTCKKL